MWSPDFWPFCENFLCDNFQIQTSVKVYSRKISQTQYSPTDRLKQLKLLTIQTTIEILNLSSKTVLIAAKIGESLKRTQ